MSKVCILGIGSPSGDDQAGWLFIDALLACGVKTGDAVMIDKLDRPGASLIALLGHASRVVLVDAMQSSGPAGRIRHFDGQDWRGDGHGLSSHGFDVLGALSLAQELGCLPPRLDLYGIEIGSLNPDAPPGAAVQAATRQLARHIAAELFPFV